jgi:hypothetical protein
MVGLQLMQKGKVERYYTRWEIYELLMKLSQESYE